MSSKGNKESGIKLMKFKELKGIEKLPSGVFTFDLLTKGGIPEGRFSLFYGDKSTGKSTFSLRLIKSFLRKYPEKQACYVDFEDAFDPRWAEKICGDVENLFVVKPAYAEEGIAVMQELLENPEIGLYVIDSLATMIPASEVESDADQEFMGLIARTVNKFLRKILPKVARHNREGNSITIILINQVRKSIGRNAYASGVTKPGGKFQEALVSLEVRFYQSGVDTKDGIPIKAEFSFTIEKNKVGGIPKMAGKYVMSLVNTNMYRQGDVIDEPVMIDFLKKFNLLVKEKNKYILFEEEYSTQAEIKKKLKENYEFREKITKELIRRFYELPSLWK